MVNHYVILECDRTDTLETIKKSYKKLILKHHPDKNDGNSERFIQINKAYHSIINERSLIVNFNDKARHYLLMLYLMMKPKNIKLNLNVSFEDIYKGITKKIYYMRYLNGKKIKDFIYVDLKNFEDTYNVEGFGDENPVTKKCGDLELIFNINYGKFDDMYINNIIDTYDVSYSVKISLYEYFYGFHKGIQFLDEIIDVSKHVPFEDGLMLNITNHGLPYENDEMAIIRGNLMLLFVVDLDIKKDLIYGDDQVKCFLNKYFSRS